MSEFVEPGSVAGVVRKEFSESYVSLRCGELYAWWQVDTPQWVRMEVARGAALVVKRAELVELVKAMEVQSEV